MASFNTTKKQLLQHAQPRQPPRGNKDAADAAAGRRSAASNGKPLLPPTRAQLWRFYGRQREQALLLSVYNGQCLTGHDVSMLLPCNDRVVDATAKNLAPRQRRRRSWCSWAVRWGLANDAWLAACNNTFEIVADCSLKEVSWHRVAAATIQALARNRRILMPPRRQRGQCFWWM
jgi:hypothetical protein